MDETEVPIHNAGFKVLTVENWDVSDPIHALFGQLSSSGQPEQAPPKIWVDQLFAPRLADTVPAEVRDLFEVARGCCIYGCFFYPFIIWVWNSYTG